MNLATRVMTAELLGHFLKMKLPLVNESGKERMRKTNLISDMLMVALLLLVCCDGVVATTTPNGRASSYSLSGRIDSIDSTGPTGSEPGGKMTSTALNLSGGGNVKLASNRSKIKLGVKHGHGISATSAATSTFVSSGPPNSRPVVGQDPQSHQPLPLQRTEQERQYPPKQANMVGIQTAYVDLNKPKPQVSVPYLQQKLSTKALIFMGVLALQFGVQPLLVSKYTHRGIIKSSVVLSQEAIKFAVAAFFYKRGSNKHQRQQVRAGMRILGSRIKLLR